MEVGKILRGEGRLFPLIKLAPRLGLHIGNQRPAWPDNKDTQRQRMVSLRMSRNHAGRPAHLSETAITQGICTRA